MSAIQVQGCASPGAAWRRSQGLLLSWAAAVAFSSVGCHIATLRFGEPFEAPRASESPEPSNATSEFLGPMSEGERASKLRTNDDPRVRAQAMAMLAQSRHPRAAAWLSEAIHDSDLDVRLAAIAALGRLADVDSLAQLKSLADHSPTLLRAAAVAALGQAGICQAVIRASDDAS